MDENSKNIYSMMFTDYPDLVDVEQMREMLGNIGSSLAYKLLRQNKISAIKIGREYRIPKISIFQYLQNQERNL